MTDLVIVNAPEAMSRLRIEILTPPSPYQTYLEERLQSARGLGWAWERTAPSAPERPAPAAAPGFAAPPQGKPA